MNKQPSLKQDLSFVARGMMMGGADIIPGVSGGTVALIVGIYNRLVTAISHFDVTLINHVRRKEWGAAANYIDLRFLVALGTGIASGILLLASTMHDLLDHQWQPTLAVFFGLILASSVLVGRMVNQWSVATVACAAAGVVIAFVLVGIPGLQKPPDSNFYVFVCGMVAICAMILPGISGAFILLILGEYYRVTGLLKDVKSGDFSFETMTTLVVFACGCAFGLISFSKILRWLLARFTPQTMALLCGFMAGSLRKIWPFKVDHAPLEEFKHKVFENVWPLQSDGDVILASGLIVIAAAFVFAAERLARIIPKESGDVSLVSE